MLKISLLGEIVIRLDGKPISGYLGQKEIALLAYLAHTGKTHNREALADLLWEASSTKQALSNLRTVLARLRKQVGDQLLVSQKTVAPTPDAHEQTDTVRLKAMLTSAGKERSITAVNLLAQGLELYGGEFMAGFSLPNAPRFNDWLVVEQEYLRQIALGGYRQLAGWQEEQGAFSAGVITAQKWVTWDPLDETAQQQLMRLLAYDGRVSEAMGVYEKCRQLLQTELGIPPDPDTTALYKTIRAGSLPPPDITPTPLHNLPRALTPLFGRNKEIETLTGYLINSEYPLISITGPGGIGKTSLALATGRHLATKKQLPSEEQIPFADGIWFVALEEIESDSPEKVRDKVAASVGQAMGLYFHGESDLWTQLLGQLASKNVLLILDNIEQFLTSGSDLFLDLLEAGDRIHLLVTSRTTLALGASVAFPLSGLQTPAEPSPEALQNESVRLFAERAARVPARFKLEEHLAEVVAICQFVEGMPLGIELAAASLGWLMVDEIMPALSSNLHLLDAKRRDLPARQRTLHAVFDYSWQLLDPRQQRLLAQISIFRGGFTRQAAEAVINEPSLGLRNLQDHALLNRNVMGRFSMHPLLRQLAREKLSDPNMIEIAEQALNRHSAYFASFMQSFENELQRGAGQEALGAIQLELANFRAAWQHAIQTGRWRVIAECLDSAHNFYQVRGFFKEGATLVDEAIVALQARMEADDLSLITLLSRLLTKQAWGSMRSAHFEKGLQSAKQACELAQKLENPGLEGQARNAWAKILAKQHKREPALAQYEEVVALAKSAQNQFLETDGWIGIGAQLTWHAEIDPAREPLHRALALCKTLDYKLGEIETLMLLGNQAGKEEAFAASIDYYEQALQLSRLLGDVEAEAEILASLGVRITALGDMVEAQTYYQEALATFRRLNMPESEEWVLGELGFTSVQLGDYDRAEKQLTSAMGIATQLKDAFWQGWLKLRLGEMWNGRGDPHKALVFLSEAYQTAEQFKYLNFQAGILNSWGDVLLNQADWANAEQKYQQAYDLRQESGRIEQASPPLAGLAYVTYQQGMLDIAAAHAEHLWQFWQESPARAERANLKLYWFLGVVWDGLGDGRAKKLWEKAHALLHKRCEKIPDEHGRKIYLEQVPAHRAIMEVSIQ